MWWRETIGGVGMCLKTPPPIVNQSNTPHFGMTVLSHIAKLSPLCEPLRFRSDSILRSTDGDWSPGFVLSGKWIRRPVPSRFDHTRLVSTVDAREIEMLCFRIYLDSIQSTQEVETIYVLPEVPAHRTLIWRHRTWLRSHSIPGVTDKPTRVHRTFYRVVIQSKADAKKQEKQGNRKSKIRSQIWRNNEASANVTHGAESGVHISALMVIG